MKNNHNSALNFLSKKLMKLLCTIILIILFFDGSAYSHEDLAQSCQPFDSAALDIAKARAQFNRAIKDSDINAISAVLTEDVVLVTGTDSEIFIGRDAQLEIWNQDFEDEARLVYLRTPSCVSMSDNFPISMERGSWHGAKASDKVNYVGGEYSAKWREVNGHWMIEVETYLTTNCGGSLCPAKM